MKNESDRIIDAIKQLMARGYRQVEICKLIEKNGAECTQGHLSNLLRKRHKVSFDLGSAILRVEESTRRSCEPRI